MSDEPPIQARTVRFSRRMDRMVRAAAQRENISVSQFIREAVLARLVYMQVTADPEMALAIEDVIRDVREQLNL